MRKVGAPANRIAGRRVAAIDGPNRYTVKPFGYYVILDPEKPDDVAKDLSRLLGVGVAVVDCNDLGSEVLGASEGVDREFVREALRDNPMGQSDQRTPMGVIRGVGQWGAMRGFRRQYWPTSCCPRRDVRGGVCVAIAHVP